MSLLCHLSWELQAGHKSATWQCKDEIAYICVGEDKTQAGSRVKRPFSECGPPNVSALRPPQTQHRVHHWQKNRGMTEWVKRKKGWQKNQAWRKTKATRQAGPKSHRAATWGWGERGRVERKSQVHQRQVFLLFLDSWVSYYRIRFNQYPPPLECGTQRWWLMGGRVFGGRCGSNGMA